MQRLGPRIKAKIRQIMYEDQDDLRITPFKDLNGIFRKQCLNDSTEQPRNSLKLNCEDDEAIQLCNKRQKQQKSPEFFDRAADESLKSSNDSMMRNDLGGTQFSILKLQSCDLIRDEHQQSKRTTHGHHKRHHISTFNESEMDVRSDFSSSSGEDEEFARDSVQESVSSISEN